MSMTMLTILQTIGVSAAYLGVTLLLPWLLLRRKLAQFRLPARFMAYFMAGNFFCINLVYLLQLLHISNRVTLVVGTAVPFLAAAVKDRERFLKTLVQGMDSAGSVSEGELGPRTLLHRAGGKLRAGSSGWLAKWLAPRWLDVLLAAGVVVLALVMYGFNTITVYGYCASDMVVHNYWINSMDANRIFVDGVYPFGFHCVIYYLHQVFAIPVYVLLRVFALPQAVMIHLMLLAFLKLVCKSKYAPYAGMAAYIGSDIFYQYAYYRYYAPLPQEYGMLFILPAAYFAIAFLQDKGFASVKKKGKAEGTARYALVLFSISVSLTLTTHFYDTMVAGLLCVGIGVGYCFRCLRWRYLRRLAAAGIAGLLIGLLPLAAAYAMGTPLQGSLRWGMNTITAVDEDSGSKPEDAGDSEAEDAPGNVLESILGEMQYFDTNDNRAAAVFMLGSVGAVFALGLLWMLLRRPDYGAVMAAVTLFVGLLYILQAAPKLGVPRLMEVSRYAMYIGYGLAAVWGLGIDGAAYLLFQERKAINLGALAGLAAVCAAVALTGIRTPMQLSAYESNDAITCLTNILRENRDGGAWTICSANDEQQMTSGKGYHYETIQFLRNMEKAGQDTALTIPTETVYFFIEKVPLLYPDYMNTVKPQRTVSAEGAQLPLPKDSGIKPYVGDSRWVVMSHMYSWAQAFRELYPYEMEVYYETDGFVCYRVRQDGYSLYDFAVDYGDIVE